MDNEATKFIICAYSFLAGGISVWIIHGGRSPWWTFPIVLVCMVVAGML